MEGSVHGTVKAPPGFARLDTPSASLRASLGAIPTWIIPACQDSMSPKAARGAQRAKKFGKFPGMKPGWDRAEQQVPFGFAQGRLSPGFQPGLIA